MKKLPEKLFAITLATEKSVLDDNWDEVVALLAQRDLLLDQLNGVDEESMIRLDEADERLHQVLCDQRRRVLNEIESSRRQQTARTLYLEEPTLGTGFSQSA